MATGLFRGDGRPSWVWVDYGTTQAAIDEPTYRKRGYLPEVDKLPSELAFFAQHQAQGKPPARTPGELIGNPLHAMGDVEVQC
jgi:hypothetical protein